MTQASTFTVLPITRRQDADDLQKAFKMIGMVGEQLIEMAVIKDVPAPAAELVALINKHQVGYSATNRGGQSHLTGELL